MKFSISMLIFFIFLISSSLAFSEIKTMEKRERHDKTVDRVMCVDGLKVFQTASYYKGVAISTIQLYETKNGKVVPATCK